MTVAAVWASLTGLEPHCSAMGTKWVEIQDMGVLHPVLRQRALCWGSPRRWGGESLPWAGGAPANCLLPLVLKAK